MINTIVLEDAPILIGNKEHKNFTDSGVKLKKGTKLTGEFRSISGLRRGEPFVYKVFVTDKKQIIYSKFIKNNMENTEVKLGADAQVTPTKVVMPKDGNKVRNIQVGSVLAGAVVGFSFAKYKKYDMKKTVISMLVGGVAGLVIAKQVVKRKGLTVQKSK